MFYFLSLELCLWGTFHINGIIQYVVSLSDFFHWTCFQGSSLLLHESVVYFFLLLNIIPLCVCTTFCQPIYQWMDFPFFFAIINNAAMDIYAQIFVWRYVSSSLKNIPRRATGGSHGKCMFDHLRNCLTGSQTGCTVNVPTSRVWRLQLLHILANTCH